MYVHALGITVVSALLLGACAADTDDPELTVDFATEAVQQEPIVSDVAAEAVALYQELAARSWPRDWMPVGSRWRRCRRRSTPATKKRYAKCSA